MGGVGEMDVRLRACRFGGMCVCSTCKQPRPQSESYLWPATRKTCQQREVS